MNSYFQCNTQYENLGDLVINKMLIDELCKHGKVFINTTDAPEKFAKYLFENPNAVDVTKEFKSYGEKFSRIKKMLFYIKHNVKILSQSPGASSPRKQKHKTQNKISDWFLHVVGIQDYIIGSCYSAFIYDKAPIVVKSKTHYLIRSNESVLYLKRNTHSVNIGYIPDLCYLLYNRVSSIPKKKIAIFDLRIISGRERDMVQWCRMMVEQFIQQGFEVVFYYQVERDLHVVEELYNHMKVPGVTFRKDIIWYDSLDFYNDKMFVVSNRLHSLLIGAAYGVFPLCLYLETKQTLKLKHVLNSSLSSQLPIFYEEGDVPKMKFIEIYERYRENLNHDYVKNAILCRDSIKKIFAIH